MMNILKPHFNFLIIILLSLISAPVMASDIIRWRVINWPPMYIPSGDYKNKGIYDQIIHLFSQKMPEIDHQIQYMNTKRVLYEMKKGENICHPSVLKDTDATLSVMNSILLPHQIIIHEDSINKLGSVTQYSLEKLLKNKSLSGGIIPGRYSKTINEIINAQKDKDHLNLYTNYHNLTKMLLEKRVDYIIEYAAAVSFETTKLQKKNITVSLDITDSDGPLFLPVYVACPKNEWGRSQINKILINESKNDDFLQSRIEWFNEENRKKLRGLYRQYYFSDKHFNTPDSELIEHEK